jgi:hypothetical protein
MVQIAAPLPQFAALKHNDIMPIVSPVFRRDVQRAAQGHRLSSRRNSGPLDETGRGIPIPRCLIEFQFATREPTWGIVSRLN